MEEHLENQAEEIGNERDDAAGETPTEGPPKLTVHLRSRPRGDKKKRSVPEDVAMMTPGATPQETEGPKDKHPMGQGRKSKIVTLKIPPKLRQLRPDIVGRVAQAEKLPDNHTNKKRKSSPTHVDETAHNDPHSRI